MSADRTVVLVTGANAGLGLATIQALYAAPEAYELILGSRSATNGEKAVKEVQGGSKGNSATTVWAVQLDLADDKSIESAFETVKERVGHVDVLVNNAGVLLDHNFEDGSQTWRQVLNTTFDVNLTGTHILSWTFAPLLLASRKPTPRLVFISSSVGSFSYHEKALFPVDAPPDEPGWPKSLKKLWSPAYRVSKAAENMLMREWYRWLGADKHVKVIAVTPGLLATNLGRGTDFLKSIGAFPVSAGAEFVKGVVEGKWDEKAGKLVGLGHEHEGGVCPW